MSSGEADVTKITVRGGNRTISNVDWGTTSNNINWTYNVPVYYYQIQCPECDDTQWCEIDREVTCACGARLRAVLDPVDFEVQVRKPKY